MTRLSRHRVSGAVFDVTKITYNMYSCVISGMSREMMKIEGRDSAECQNWGKNDKMGILEFVLNENKTKVCIVLIFSN